LPRVATAERGGVSIAVFARIGAYAELSKLGIVLLVLVSAAAGFMLAAPLGPSFPWRDGLLMLAAPPSIVSSSNNIYSKLSLQKWGSRGWSTRQVPDQQGPARGRTRRLPRRQRRASSSR